MSLTTTAGLLAAADRVREASEAERPPASRARLLCKLRRVERLISEGHGNLTRARDSLVRQLEEREATR